MTRFACPGILPPVDGAKFRRDGAPAIEGWVAATESGLVASRASLIMFPLTNRLRFLCACFLLAVAATALDPSSFGQSAPAFTKVIVFGDSLSDDGNIARRVEDLFFLRYPGHDFDYADGRFTNSTNTFPPALRFAGVWHEQLATAFLQVPVATNSLDGGLDYAYGGATTNNGITQRTVISNTTPFGGGQLSIPIDNLGRQITNYLASHTPDPAALYIVWGGGNDLFDDASSANVTATADRVGALVTRLAVAGARNFLVPNVPALGDIPHYNSQPGMSATLDAASVSYRTQLDAALDVAAADLVSQGVNAQIFRFDVYTLFQTMVAQPAYFGFANTSDSAQLQLSVNPDAYIFWDDIHPTSAAHFQLAAAANRVLSGAGVTTSSLLNISARSRVETGDNVMIAGFIIGGSRPKRVLVRGMGPTLTALGVPGALSNPTLTLFNEQTQPLATNDNWKSTQQSQIAATPYAPGDDRESALIVTLDPGRYTAILSGVSGETGIGLLDVFDLDTAIAPASRPINVSARAHVLTGDNVLISGFMVSGTGPRRVMVRAIGPSLASFGVPGSLADPVLNVIDAQGQTIASNDNWQDTQQAEIAATPYAPQSNLESAVIVTLNPGSYTAIVQGRNGTTGVALVEVYELP